MFFTRPDNRSDWRTPIIGGLELMINRMKDSLFLRVMANLFPIVLNGTPVMGQKAHLRIVYFMRVKIVRHSNGLIGNVQLAITLYASKIHDLTEQNRVLQWNLDLRKPFIKDCAR